MALNINDVTRYSLKMETARETNITIDGKKCEGIRIELCHSGAVQEICNLFQCTNLASCGALESICSFAL